MNKKCELCLNTEETIQISKKIKKKIRKRDLSLSITHHKPICYQKLAQANHEPCYFKQQEVFKRGL